MATKRKITISWSGGKDSAFALHLLLQSQQYEVMNLHTIIDRDSRRVGLHGVREELVEAQARQIDITLIKGILEASNDGAEYKTLVREMYRTFRSEGITHIMFGDIFLEDLRAYREELLQESGLVPVYPLWNMKSRDMVDEFLKAGFKTIICSSNEACFNAGMLGKLMDEAIFGRIPSEVDPCGENGEYHSFVFDGPVFRKPVAITLGDVVTKNYEYTVIDNGAPRRKTMVFYFQDILTG